jgi:2-isopropylmalate synthase/UPF0716 protein FxsA
MITSSVVNVIGGFYLFLEIIFSAILGFYIISSFKYRASESLMMLFSNRMSLEEFQRMSLFTLLGAFLLIIPGIFSDILGILLQFNAVGIFFAKKILHLKNKKRRKDSEDEAIDAEIIDVDVIE